MLETMINSAVREYDDEVVKVYVDGRDVKILYSDGTTYSGVIRIDGNTMTLQFGDIFAINLKLTVKAEKIAY